MITTETGRKLAEKWKAVFVEASAKQNDVSYFLGTILKRAVVLGLASVKTRVVLRV